MLKNDRWRTKTRVGKIAGTLLMLLFISSLVALALPPYLEIEDQNLGAGNVPIPPAAGSTAIVQGILVSDYEEVVQTESAQPVHIIEIAVDSLGTAGAEDIAFIRIWNENGGLNVSADVSAFPVTVCSGVDLVIPDEGEDTLWVEVTLSGNASHGAELQLQTWIKYWEDRQDNPRWGFATDGDPETLVDVTPPTDPTLSSTSHDVGEWSNDSHVLVTATGASDATSGVDGFEVAWIQSSTWTPTETKNEEESWSGDTFTATSNGDWYLHVATVDNAGNWTTTTYIGPFKIDTSTPDVVETLCYTHSGGTEIPHGAWTNDNTLYFEWTAPNSLSGDTFYYELNHSSGDTIGFAEATVPVNHVEMVLPEESDNWWFHVAAKNGARTEGPQGLPRKIQIKYDSTPPAVTAPGDLTLECGASGNEATYNDWLASATAIDNYDSLVEIVDDGAAFANLPRECAPGIGVLVTWVGTDDAGNIGTNSAVVKILDTTKPVISCPADVTVKCDESTDPENTGLATATDVCDPNPVITYSDVSTKTSDGSCTDFSYTITRTWTATDACNNSLSCDQMITVVDDIKPVITCPAGVTVKCNESTDPANTGSATATDVCDPNPVITYSDVSTKTSDGSCTDFSYTITRTWTATDACNNSSSCDQTITVVDDIKPVITCPAGGELGCNPTIPTAYTMLVEFLAAGGTVSDNCDLSPTITLVSEVYNPDPPNCATTLTRTYKATDACGNDSETCAQVFTFTADTTPPEITCPASGELGCNPTIPAAYTTLVEFLAAGGTVNDNCDLSPTITLVSEVYNPDPPNCATTLTRTYKATDACGNDSETCTQVFTFTADTTPPEISNYPSDITIDNDEGLCSAVVTWVEPTANDNCDGAMTYTTRSHAPGSTFPVGTTVVTYTFTDTAGNTAKCSFDVTVLEAEAPTLTVPADVTIECDESILPANTGQATATDNCCAVDDITITHTDVADLTGCCGTGTIIRTWRAKDACGNFSIGVQTITVVDTTPPTWDQIPPEDVLVLEDDIPSPPTLTASDNCDNDVDVVYEQIGGATGSSYTLERKWTATDDCGNTTVHSQGVSVVVIPDDVTVECGESTDPSNTGTIDELDNKFIDTVVEYDDSEDGTCPTFITRTWTVTDEDDWSKSVEGEQIITVEDTTPPEITCPEDLTLECDPATNADDVDAWLASVAASDVCGDVTITNDYAGLSGGCNDETGSAVVTFTATDECDNESTCQATVTVVDTTPPEITCPGDVTLECPADTTPASTGTATGSDACGDVTITYSDAVTEGCGNTKTIVRTWTAEDECGLSTSCDQTITVADTIPPENICPEDVTIECDAGTCEATEVDLGMATATDSCDPSPSLSNDAPGVFPLGETVVTWTATDACGNSNACTQLVTVIDEEAPTLAFTQVPPEVSSDSSPHFEWAGNDNCIALEDLLFSTQLDGGAWSAFSHATSADIGPLEDGDHTFQVRATDAAGNSGISGVDTFTIASERPVVAITSPESGLVTGTSELEVTYTISGTDLSSAEFLHNGTATAIAPEDGSITITLIPGENTLEVTATNVAGTSSSGTVTVTYDIIPPVVEITAPLDDQVLGVNTCTVTGTVDDPDVSEVTLLVNGVGEAVGVTAGAFIRELTGLTDGETYKIEAQATDAVGNTGSSGIVMIRVNMSQPVVAITSPPSGFVTGTSELLVTYAISGVDLSSATFLHNGAATTITPTDGSIAITLTAGDNALEVRATNVAGTSSSGTVTVTYDITPPVVEITAPLEGQVLGINACTVTGTVDDPEVTEVTLLVNGVAEVISLASPFTKELTGLTDGATYEIEARATDAAGNTGSSGIVTIRVNTSQPVVAITSPPSGSVTGTSELEVAYEISGVDLSSAEFLHNGVATAIAPANGSITITLTPAENTLEVSATNVAGTSSSGVRIVTYDTVPPVVEITSPADGTLVTVPSVQVTGTIDDPEVSYADLIINGEAAAVISVVDGRFSHTITLEQEGLNGIEVKATDACGNTGSSGTIGVDYDPGKPDVEVKHPTNAHLTNFEACAVDGTVTHGAAITDATLYVNGVAGALALTLQSDEGGQRVYAFNTTATLIEGENALAVESTDEFGESASSGTISVTLDTTAPLVAITAPVTGYLTNQETVLVTGTVDDPAVNQVVLNVNGTEKTIGVAAGSFSREVSLIEGDNTLEATASDSLGNEGSSGAVVVTYDSAAPAVSITLPATGTKTNSASVTVTYTIAPEATSAEFILNGVSEEITPESGSRSVSLVEGDNTLEVRASDGVNVGSSGVVRVILDETAPSVTVELSEPAETILITVRSNEALASPPTVEVTNGVTTEVEMTLTGVREWTGSYTIPEDGSYLVEVSGTDEAGNGGSYSTSFSRESVSAVAGATIAVERDQLRLDIEVSEDVSDQSIATTLYTKDPRWCVEPEAAIFVKVDMGIALQRAIVEMGIEAFYDPAKLPEGTDESTLKLYLWTPSKGGWSLVEGATVDTTEHSITGAVTH